MKSQITDAEIVLCLQHVRTYGNINAAVVATGIPDTTFRKRVDAGKRRGLTADSHVLTEADRLRAQVRSLEQDVKRLAVEQDTAEDIRRRVFDLASRTPAAPNWVSPKRGGPSSPEVPVLFISDIHFGEVVDPVEVAGTNAYNSKIAEQRLMLLFNTAAELIERDGGAKNGVVVCLGGDMITGDIHEELADTNDLYTPQAVVVLAGILETGLRQLADQYGRLYVPCVVGNHGRTSKRMRMKGRVYTSWEYLLYCMLERAFKDDDRVHFDIPGEADCFFKVNGKRFLLTHGDSLGVKGGDGIIGAIGPIMRGSVKLGNSESQIGRDFDYLMMGHWHYPLYLPHTLVNGSPKGYDEYARLGLRVPYAPASQLLFRVHPTHGLTVRREIILQEPYKTAPAGAWVEVLPR
ncbi:hypothetical protein UFOVP134_13 [uncultured Caudovirales phage]|uniref:Uncharacterized protein n=1 Tax=uncultured Caudovirales phage TaxID=2100421 RepID=A0A6J5LC07_9CAUD|nr:hypothetical protein UFOVP134_13 [uncultured Caudovirales phage]